MWIVLVVQIVLSIAMLAALFITVAWLQSSAREGRETKRLLENLSTLFQNMVGASAPGPSAAVTSSPAKARQGGSANPLAVKVGTEVVELDADTIARIEALKEDVQAGRTDGHLLQLLIEAGLHKAEHGDRISGEVPRAPEDGDADEPTRDTPANEVTPTPPKKPTQR